MFMKYLKFFESYKSNLFMNELLVYRGAHSPEFGKGEWNGVWVSPFKEVANQWSPKGEDTIWKYSLSDNINLINTTNAIARQLEAQFIHKFPEQEEYVNQSDDFAELWMFPPPEFVDMLTDYGYDGYINGTDYFIINTVKLTPTDI